MSRLDDFNKKVFGQFEATITDRVFLLIQNDHELMHEYLRLVHDKGLDTVNQQIGKAVKEHFKLENAAERGTTPNSTLIQSFQIFED